MYWLRKALANGNSEAESLLATTERVINSFCANCSVKFVDEKCKKRCCSRCRAANYCSTECQRIHWKRGHKKFCVDKDMDIKDVEIDLADLTSSTCRRET